MELLAKKISEHLQSLRLKATVNNKCCSVKKALEYLCDIITKLATQGTRVYRSEEAKEEYTFEVVIGSS